MRMNNIMAKCVIKGCTEDATTICELERCTNLVCDMHAYSIQDPDNKNRQIFCCEGCYGKK
jgi:hypothetical protein